MYFEVEMWFFWRTRPSKILRSTRKRKRLLITMMSVVTLLSPLKWSMMKEKGKCSWWWSSDKGYRLRWCGGATSASGTSSDSGVTEI